MAEADTNSSGTQVHEHLLQLFTLMVEGKRPSLGRPKLVVSRDHLQDLIEMDLSVPCISRELGISVKTVRRRMQQWGLSIKERYSKVTDKELDGLVSAIKADSPKLGQRMIRGRLKALGHRVQATRVWDSMHRVKYVGTREKMTNSGCNRRTTFNNPAPLSLIHINTSHKLVRYGIVMFGGIDVFSRKILYLQAANNNKASTALEFFLQAVDRHGFPSRVRGDQSAENMDIARHMFEFGRRGRRSFISGKSDCNQRIDHLWREVWNDVSSIYYDLLHSLEEDGLLNPANCKHLFCAQYVFLPRIQKDLDIFTDGWNNHSLGTDRDPPPKQLWEVGELQSLVSPPHNPEKVHCPDVKMPDVDHTGVQVPEVQSPLSIKELEGLHQLFDPTAPSLCFGADIYCAVVHYVDGVLESGQEA